MSHNNLYYISYQSCCTAGVKFPLMEGYGPLTATYNSALYRIMGTGHFIKLNDVKMLATIVE